MPDISEGFPSPGITFGSKRSPEHGDFLYYNGLRARRGAEIGRQPGLRIQCPQGRAGSIPVLGTSSP